MAENFFSLDELKKFWPERATPCGLIVLLFSLNLTLLPIANWVYGKIKDFGFNKETQFPFLFFSSTFVIILLPNLIAFLIWLYWRSMPRFQCHENAILFAPHYDPECGSLVQSIFQRFVFELGNRVPENCITPKFLLPHQKVHNSEEANRLLNETGARLVVYGLFDQGESAGGKISGFKSVSFTVKHRNLMNWEQSAVIEDLVNALAFRAFTINSANSFIEKDIVVNNLTEVALFFVALALTLESKLDIALGILKDLHSNIKSSIKLKRNSPYLKRFFRSILRCYSVALNAKFMNFFNSKLLDNITDRNYDMIFLQGEKILKDLFEIDSRKDLYFLRQAIFDLHFDRIHEAFENIGKAKKLAPQNEPSPLFSLAFLCLYKGQYKRAISEYKKILNITNHSSEVLGHVLYFIQTFYERYPARPEFLFALGFMNQNFFDIDQAGLDYSRFLSLANGNICYNPLIDYARKQLEFIDFEKKEAMDQDDNKHNPYCIN